MLALSIGQPYAELILRGIKTVAYKSGARLITDKLPHNGARDERHPARLSPPTTRAVTSVTVTDVDQVWSISIHHGGECPPLPLLCPTCGLPSRLDVDPSTVTDDLAELARLERAMARLIGVEDPEPSPRQRPDLPASRVQRRQRDDRPALRGQTLGEMAAHAWG